MSQRTVRDRYLPPDREAFVAAEPPTGRVIVIAPTRAACETIELALHLQIETFLQRTHGDQIRRLAREGKGFGIVAGTGTGKTLSIRPIAEEILRTIELRVGVVNREREATPETPTWNVIIVTTGIARRWFEDDDILPSDTLIVDEIHQTSAELELCLALGKRVGCRFVWLSATVDPTFYKRYLSSAAVIESYAFDPGKRARVKVLDKKPLDFLDERFLQETQRQRRGVALFVPTRAGVEEAAEHVELLAPRVNVAFYHGGEPIRILRPFLEGGERKPYFLSMTAAGQSALNVQGLDTVIIDDVRFSNVIERGKNVLTKLHLGANEILQMAGRVHGRVENGRVFILSDRDIEFDALRPTEPEFQLAGDSERVAMTCAALGVRADELDLPVPLDRRAYRDALALLESRGIVEHGKLTRYGKLVEAMPVERAWAELLVNADDDMVPFLAVMSSVESLHRMTRDERVLEGLVVPGSDHLTAYNLYAEAYDRTGHVGEVYGLPRHLFDEEAIQAWAEERGALVKAVEDAALGMASVYRAIGLPLPATMPYADDEIHRRFADLLARFMPLALVIDERTPAGDEVRVSRTSVCGSWGAIAGTIRYFADRFGIPRASIEGTQIPYDLVRKYAKRTAATIVYDADRKRSPLALSRKLEYFGFDLAAESEPIEEFPTELADDARRVLAEALAREEARHVAVKRFRDAIHQVRESWRRSGGRTPRLGQAELTSMYERALEGVSSVEEFRRSAIDISAELDAMVSPAERARWMVLPAEVEVRGKPVPIDYDVEERDGAAVGVARLRLPEKLARTLAESELPRMDRPVRFIVTRGPRGAVRASSLDELQELLDRPWSDAELERLNNEREERRERKSADRRDRRVKEVGKELRRSKPSRGGGNGRDRERDARARPKGRGRRRR